MTLQPGMQEDGLVHRARVRVQPLSTLSNSSECDMLSTGTAHPFSSPEQRPYSYTRKAIQSLPRVHCILGPAGSKQVSRRYIRGRGPPCCKKRRKKEKRFDIGVESLYPETLYPRIFLQRERTSLAGKLFFARTKRNSL